MGGSRGLDHLSCLFCRRWRSQRSCTLPCKMRIKTSNSGGDQVCAICLRRFCWHQGGSLWWLPQERAEHPHFPAHPTCQMEASLADDVWDVFNEYVISHVIILLISHYNDQSHWSNGFSVLCEEVLQQSSFFCWQFITAIQGWCKDFSLCFFSL